MEEIPANDFTAIILVRSLLPEYRDEIMFINEPMAGNGFVYPRNCREDIEAILNCIRDEFEFEDLEPLDVCEIITATGETLWNEGATDGVTT